MSEVDPRPIGTPRHHFSRWSDEEKEQLLAYLHTRYYLFRKTDFWKVTIEAVLVFFTVILLCIYIYGGIGSYINNQVEQDVNSNVEGGVRSQLSQLQKEAQGDVDSLHEMVLSSKQNELTIDKAGWGNVEINSLAVKNLSILDADGNAKIILGTDIDNSGGPAMDFVSSGVHQTSASSGTVTVSKGVSIHVGNFKDQTGLFLFDPSRTLRMSEALLGCGCADISFYDNNGVSRLELYFGSESNRKNPTGFISLYNSEQNTIFQAYEGDTSEGNLLLGDKDGNSTFAEPQ